MLQSLDFILLVAHRDLVRLFLEMPHQFKKDGFIRPEGEPQASEGAPRRLAGFKAYLNRHAPVLRQSAIKLGLRAPPRHSSWVPIEEIAQSERAKQVLKEYQEEIGFVADRVGSDNLYASTLSSPNPLYFRVVTLAEWVRKNGFLQRHTEHPGSGLDMSSR